MKLSARVKENDRDENHDSDCDAGIGYIENRPSFHDEVGEIHVNKVGDLTEQQPVNGIADGTG